MTYVWGTESVTRLTELWGQGWSAGLIADDMQGGLTRCAVIGKIHRLGLVHPYGIQHSKRRSARGRRRRPHPKPSEPRPPRFTERPASPPPRMLEPVSRGLSILELTGRTCKWPSGDMAPYSFCGHGTEPGSPYCPWHSEKAFNGIPERTKRMGRMG